MDCCRYAAVWCSLALLSGCDRSAVPGAPVLLWSSPTPSGVRLTWLGPVDSGRTAIANYTAICTAPGERLTALASHNPAQVDGLSPGTRYQCRVTASNGSGTGAPSNALEFMPTHESTRSLAVVYRAAAWAGGMSVTFPSECTMTLLPAPRPRHGVDSLYLAPLEFGSATKAMNPDTRVVARTAISRMPLVLRAYEGEGVHEPISVNICPSQSAKTTATNSGVIGVMVSGATLYKAAEIPGHRATALNDNVRYRRPVLQGVPKTVGFLDACGGHPTPTNAGNSYHYHGHSACVTSLVDRPDGPSHLLGVALDGFPIYGDRDMQGNKIDPATLDACNGITSPTPEFPQGMYHYVLPSGVQQHHAAMRCYAGHVPTKLWLAAETAGFCYSPDQASSAGPMGMPMRTQGSKAVIGK